MLSNGVTGAYEIIFVWKYTNVNPFSAYEKSTGPDRGRDDAKAPTALLWTSTDGSLGFVSPLEESAFRRLDFLATKMVVGLPLVCIASRPH